MTTFGTGRTKYSNWIEQPDPIVGARPSETGRDSFPSSGSSASNAPWDETRFEYSVTITGDPHHVHVRL